MKHIENFADSIGLADILLLTETALQYFAAKGFKKVTRNDVPVKIKNSTIFSHLCPI